MNRITNINNISKDFIDDPEFESPMKTLWLGHAAGCEKIYVNMDFVKPGGISVKYHSHSRQEEFFMIMSGTGILRMNDTETVVGAGDIIAKPAGKHICHQFLNKGNEILQILDIGTIESDDEVTYPDENVIYIKNKNKVFSLNDSIKGWTSDPNL